MNTDNRLRFLIIDDHPFIRHGVIHYLTAHEGFECLGDFGDTRSVLNASLAGNPDVIILDLNMPDIDGEKSIGMLKRKFPHGRFVAFTSYAGREKELTRLGFDGYIIKSEKDSLVDALRNVAAGRKHYPETGASAPASHAELDGLDSFLKLKQLTAREIEVARYMVQDYTNREIGERIFISEATVETHRKHIKQKLMAKNKRELYAMLKSFLQEAG